MLLLPPFSCKFKTAPVWRLTGIPLCPRTQELSLGGGGVPIRVGDFVTALLVEILQL